MSKGSAMVLGFVIGGGLGYIIGTIIADYVAPEYYTEEELEALAHILANEEYDDGGEDVVVTINDKGEREEREYRDYTKFHKTEDIQTVKSRYDNQVDDEALVDDEGNYLEEDDIWEDIPMIDLDNLEGTDPQQYVDMRDTDVPYIMLEYEFEAEENGFKQAVLKYYPEDDVLTDEKNTPVMNISRIIGDHALNNFGVFASDEDTVYVCNPNLEFEYRVIRLDGSYENKVVKAPRKSSKPIVVPEEEELEVHNIFEDRDKGEPSKHT